MISLSLSFFLFPFSFFLPPCNFILASLIHSFTRSSKPPGSAFIHRCSFNVRTVIKLQVAMPFYCELRNPYFLHHRVPSSSRFLSFFFFFLDMIPLGRNCGRGAPRVIGYAPEKPKNRTGGWLAIVRAKFYLRFTVKTVVLAVSPPLDCLYAMHSYHRADRSTKRFTVENRRIFLLPITLHGLRPVLSCHSYTFESVFALLTRSLRGWSLKDSLEEVAREKTCFSVRDASVRGHLRLLSTCPPHHPFSFPPSRKIPF